MQPVQQSLISSQSESKAQNHCFSGKSKANGKPRRSIPTIHPGDLVYLHQDFTNMLLVLATWLSLSLLHTATSASSPKLSSETLFTRSNWKIASSYQVTFHHTTLLLCYDIQYQIPLNPMMNFPLISLAFQLRTSNHMSQMLLLSHRYRQSWRSLHSALHLFPSLPQWFTMILPLM